MMGCLPLTGARPSTAVDVERTDAERRLLLEATAVCEDVWEIDLVRE
jgi:hypothetical protein